MLRSIVVRPPFGVNEGTPIWLPSGSPVTVMQPPSTGICLTPATDAGHVAVSVTTIGVTVPLSPIPTWNHALSFTAWATGVPQPTGRFDTHGIFVAVGTACANVIIVRSESQLAGSTAPRVGKNNGIANDNEMATIAIAPAISATRRKLHRWIAIGLRAGASSRKCDNRSRPSCFID